jgi:tRNA uridine 5-carbamoylmethylation protein Kti12
MVKSNRTKSYRVKKNNKSRKKRGGDKDDNKNTKKKDDCMKKIPTLLKAFLRETIIPEKRTLFNVRGCEKNMFGIKKLNQIDVGGLKKIFKEIMERNN